MKKIIIIIVTIALVASIFYLSLPRVSNNVCVMGYDVSKGGAGCPGIGQTCRIGVDDNCAVCCALNAFLTFSNRLYVSAIACFVLFAIWRIFKNKLKSEEIGIVAKTLLFLGIIGLVMNLLSYFRVVQWDLFPV